MVDYTKPCFIDGKPVRILCTDRPGDLSVVAVDEQGNLYCRQLDGTLVYSTGLSPIINVPERRSKFYPAYKNGGSSAFSWPTLAAVRASTTPAAILEIEYEDGLPVSAKLHPMEEGK